MNSAGDFFGGVMRSAGLAGRAAPAGPNALSAPMAAGEPADPFEAIKAEQITPATEAAPAPLAAPLQALPTAPLQPPASTPAASALSPRLADIARDAPPAIQAALRWIAAGEPEATLPATATPQLSAAPFSVAARLVQQVEPGQLSLRAEAITPPKRADASPAAQPGRTEPAPEAASSPVIRSLPMKSMPATAPHALASRPTPDDAVPPRRGAVEPAPAAPRSAAEVHIGTLHVMLDASATARFAAPRTVVAPAAPEAPRPNTAARPEAGSGRSFAPGAGLSRSRLPRW